MNKLHIGLAVLSGFLLVVAFPEWNIWPLAWFGLVPLFYAIKEKTVFQGFWLGAITGSIFFIGTVYWVTNSIHFYGNVPFIPASGVTLLLCAYLCLYFGVFGAVFVHLRKYHPLLVLIAAPALWTALELARTYVFSGFPWVLLGYSQYQVLPIIQIADITGVYGISFLIVMVNVALEQIFRNKRQYAGILVACFILVLVLGYGWNKLQASETNNDEITIAVIQGNIEQDKKWDTAFQVETIETYKKLTETARLQNPDIIIWPETATPFYFTGQRVQDQVLTQDLIKFAKSIRTPILFGSPTYTVKPDRRITVSNSAFLLSREGTIEAQYDKIHLVPFGEYVPLRTVLFFVGKMVEAIGDFESGDTYTVMTVPSRTSGKQVPISTVICYEIIFPDLVRQFVQQGAGVITTITNDAWFGKTAAPYQHFSMAVFRAIENRVPIARAANTGISGFIDAKGTVLDASDIFVPTYLIHRIIPGSARTFYTSYGDLFSYLCLVLSFLMLIDIMKKRSWFPKNH
ncbi:MAG: apolipoprotein N-acyltransferase [Nitrospirota bacterium]